MRAAAAVAANTPSLVGARQLAAASREKNRQAQRRFRERQKTTISALSARCDAFEAALNEETRLGDALRAENAVLRMLVRERMMQGRGEGGGGGGADELNSAAAAAAAALASADPAAPAAEIALLSPRSRVPPSLPVASPPTANTGAANALPNSAAAAAAQAAQAQAAALAAAGLDLSNPETMSVLASYLAVASQQQHQAVQQQQQLLQ